MVTIAIPVDTSIAALETLAVRAWPAAEVLSLDGWLLRHTHGVTRRANSVWPGAGTGASSPTDRLNQVETFYRQRGLPARYQLSPMASPTLLDRTLQERGYVLEAPVSIQTCAISALPAQGEAGFGVRVDAAPSPAFLDFSARHGRFANVQSQYRGFLQRIGERGLYAVAHVGDGPAATALGVLGGDWLGVFGMFTHESQRHRGLARALLSALARAATGRAHSAFLQVARDNDPALALYASVGFSERYGYHYRTQQSGPSTGSSLNGS